MKQLLFIIIPILLFTTAFSQEYFSLLDKKKIIKIKDNTESYDLDFQNIISNSEKVIVQSDTLKKNIDYKIFYKEGKIKIFKLYLEDTEIIVSFKVFPEELKYSFSKFKKKIISDKKDYRPIRIKTKSSKYPSSSNLNISGSKSFSISVGNQEDMDFDQSLYLQLDGELSDKIFIKAQLSDNNSPIAPEGTTKKISELDKMFIKVYSGNYALSFGDFFCKFDDTHFANYEYKLEGVNFQLAGRNKFDISAAISNGDFISHKFYGVEGKQGPYYLPGKSSSNVKILSGTEKIYFNGKLLSRGDDYTIDYNEGSLTFKNKNVITEDSYIIADYEYSAEDFRSNFYLGSGNFSLFDNNAELFFKILSNNNDKEKPLNYTFSSYDKEILSQAGDDPTKARKSGVDSVAVGSGNYIKVDTHYEYIGFDSTGNFLVSFSYVGDGKGSYKKSGYNQYEWVGDGNGDYIPEIQLPMPEKNLNLDFGAKLNLGKVSIYSEGIISNYDKNSFSKMDDEDDNGFALYNELKFKSDIFNFGRTENSFFYQYIDKNFHPLTRTESAETEYENYQFIEVDTVDAVQYGGDIRFEIQPKADEPLAQKNWVKNRTKFSEKNMKSIAKSRNLSNRFSYFQNRDFPYIPSINYNYSRISEESNILNNQTLKQEVHDLNGNYKYDFVNLMAGYYERRFESEGVFSHGIKIDKNFYRTNFDFGKVKMTLEYERENQDSLNINWQKFKQADLWKGNIYHGGEKFNIRSEYSHRKNTYFNGMQDSKFDLINTQISMNFLKRSIYNRFNYKIGNLEIFPKVRELVFVGYGRGIYDSLGFYQEDGDYDYEITRIGNPQPITELEFNWNITLNPARFIPKLGLGNEGKNSQFVNLLSKLLFTSDISIQEKSRTPHKMDLYLLRKNALMNKDYTDYGYQKFREQIWYNIKKNKIVTKLLYEKTKKMDKQYLDVDQNIIFDKLWQDEWNFELNLYNINKWNLENEISYKNRTSNYQTADFLKSKNYRISTDIGYKFNYNMIFSTEFGYDFEKGNKEDGSESYQIYSYQIEPSFVYNSGSKYHIMAQFYFQSNKREGSDYLANVLINKRNGIITRATLQFDYKFSKYITGFLKYYTEKYPESEVRNQLRMEVRADF
ncbi:MAG: hypothetical protein KAW92_04955 [Candidatus Cloacimonetes bacterium]|nr:hypothetical protein [Candidatus Cloacimonadota bacterium]